MANNFNIKIFFIFIFSAIFNFCMAQNLVPNPGFEEHNLYSVNNWEQTEMPYYHFEINSTKAHSGNCLNGLCIWRTQASEYLQVKLDSPLIAGRKYDVSCYTMVNQLTGSTDSIQYVGILFSKEKFNVSSKKILCVKPSLFLNVILNPQWQKFESSFIANGGEQYMLVGHFYKTAGTNNYENDTTYQNILLQIEKIDLIKAEEIDTAIEIIEKKYKNIQQESWNIAKIKSKKKQEKLIKEYKKSLVKKQIEIQNKTNEINKDYAEKLDQIYYKNNIEPSYSADYNRFRLNFDDFSVTPAKEKVVATVKVIPLKNVFFNTGKSDLLPQSFIELDSQVEFLKTNAELNIEVSGHTDNVGIESENITLSNNRAKAVADYLIQKGINASRITYKGYGSSKSITTNATEEGRAKNRRVELKISEK